MSYPPSWPAQPSYAPAPPVGPVRPGPVRARAQVVLATVGALLLLIGMFVPWTARGYYGSSDKPIGGTGVLSWRRAAKQFAKEDKHSIVNHYLNGSYALFGFVAVPVLLVAFAVLAVLVGKPVLNRVLVVLAILLTLWMSESIYGSKFGPALRWAGAFCCIAAVAAGLGQPHSRSLPPPGPQAGPGSGYGPAPYAPGPAPPPGWPSNQPPYR